MNNPYKILGISEDAEDIVIKAAYRALANKYHPDKWQGSKEEAERKIREINNAYDFLNNQKSKKGFDYKRENQQEKNNKESSQKNSRKKDTNYQSEKKENKENKKENFQEVSDFEFLILPSFSNYCLKLATKFHIIISILFLLALLQVTLDFQNVNISNYHSPPRTIGGEYIIYVVSLIFSITHFFSFLYVLLSIESMRYKIMQYDGSFTKFITSKFNQYEFIEILFYGFVFNSLIVGVLAITRNTLGLSFSSLLGVIFITLLLMLFCGYAVMATPFQKRRLTKNEKYKNIIIFSGAFNLLASLPSEESGIPLSQYIQVINLICFFLLIEYLLKASKGKENFKYLKNLYLFPILIYSYVMLFDAQLFDFGFYKNYLLHIF